jgi:hypothetical protein
MYVQWGVGGEEIIIQSGGSTYYLIEVIVGQLYKNKEKGGDHFRQGDCHCVMRSADRDMQL